MTSASHRPSSSRSTSTLKVIKVSPTPNQYTTVATAGAAARRTHRLRLEPGRAPFPEEPGLRLARDREPLRRERAPLDPEPAAHRALGPHQAHPVWHPGAADPASLLPRGLQRAQQHVRRGREPHARRRRVRVPQVSLAARADGAVLHPWATAGEEPDPGALDERREPADLRPARHHTRADRCGGGAPDPVALADADHREPCRARSGGRGEALVINQGGHRVMRLREMLLMGVVAGLAAVTPLAGTAAAQQYPTRPVEVVVPFVPGGGSDLIARATADYLGKKWGQPILVVNKPGGGGVIGARAALKEARPDGYTVLVDIHTTVPMMIGAWKTPALALSDRKAAARVQHVECAEGGGGGRDQGSQGGGGGRDLQARRNPGRGREEVGRSPGRDDGLRRETGCVLHGHGGRDRDPEVAAQREPASRSRARFVTPRR